MTSFKKSCVSIALALCSLAASAFPTKPLTIVVPYAAGGSTDVLARILAESLSRDLGQPVVVDNVGGAGGTIGTTKVVRASNDGHTLLLHNMGIATAPALYNKLPFDVTKDLEPIALVGDVPMILVGNKNFAPSNVSDLIKLMKAKPSQAWRGEVFACRNRSDITFVCHVDDPNNRYDRDDGALQRYWPCTAGSYCGQR